MSPDLLSMRLEEISERIRRGRENAGLTLVQLGKRSEVAPSTIQKIECRQMTPSIAILLKIAAGLKLDAGDLIAPSNPSLLDTIVQRAGQQAVIAESSNLTSVKLSADILGAELECWRILMRPGHSSRLSRAQALDEQVIVCEKGVVELDLGDVVHRLQAGDTLHCRRRHLHGFNNPGNTPAAYLIMGKFPHNVQAEIASRQE